MTIELYEEDINWWKGRILRKYQRFVWGASLEEVLGAILWHRQYEFQSIDGVYLIVHYQNGRMERYNRGGERMTP